MDLFIRNALLSDAKTIAILSNQLGYPSDEVAIQDRLKTIIPLPDHVVLVCVYNEKIVGWIHGFYTFRVASDPFIEIGGLVVHEEHRKQGIGKQLVSTLMDWAKTKDCKKVRVRCNALRTESHIFYEQLGFKLNKTQQVFDKHMAYS